MERFAQYLRKNGVGITLRRSRGKDIDAACGQLAGEVKDRTKRKDVNLAEKHKKPNTISLKVL